MKFPFKLLSASLLLMVLAPAASAKEVVVAPLISKGASDKQLINVGSLVSSELDFRPEYDGAREMRERPEALNSACLDSAPCLGGIAGAEAADILVAGTLAATEIKFTLDLVLFDAATGKIVRRKEFALPASPEAVADGMGAVVMELVTGKSKAEVERNEDDLGDLDLDVEDDFEFDDESLEGFDPAADAIAREEAAMAEERARLAKLEAARLKLADKEARQRAEAEAARERAEAERRAREEEERRRSEERRRAEEERRRQEEEARRRAEEEAFERSIGDDSEGFDPSMIEFGSSTDKIRVESAEDIEFGRPPDIRVESSRDSYYADDDLLLEEEEEGDEFGIVDLDSDEKPDRRKARSSSSDRDRERSKSKSDRERSKSSSDRDRDRDRERSTAKATTSRSSRTSSARDPRVRVERDPDRHAVSIAARGGYSNFQGFDFITAGGELFLPVAAGVYITAGLESYSVQRQIPAAHQTEGQITEWNTIFPINVGAVYKLADGNIDPYFGLDLIMAQYYFDDGGKASWSVGARARGGADFMVADQFGFNANVALGYWSGKDWYIIRQDLKSGGLLPQLSVGPVVLF